MTDQENPAAKTADEILKEKLEQIAAEEKAESAASSTAASEPTQADSAEQSAEASSAAAEWTAEWTSDLELRGQTGAYERYHNADGEKTGSRLSEETKQEIRRRVARTLTLHLDPNAEHPISPIGDEKLTDTTELATAASTESAEAAESTQSADSTASTQNTDSTQNADLAASTQTAESTTRGVLSGEGEGEAFSYTDFRMKRANAVKDFFNNMRDFTFTRTNHESVEMLHMHQPSEKKQPEDPTQTPEYKEAREREKEASYKERTENLYNIITSEEKNSFLRAAITGALAVISLLLLTVRGTGNSVTLCGFELQSRALAALQLLILLIGGAVSFNLFVGSYRLIKSKRFGKEQVCSVIYIAGLLNAFLGLVAPAVMQKEYFTCYTGLYLFAACSYHIGLNLQMRRLQKQLETASDKNSTVKYSLEPLENRFLLQNLDPNRRDDSLVVKQVEADSVAGFENHGFSPDWFDRLSKTFLIALCGIALVAAIGAWILSGDWMKAVFVFTGAFGFCSPFAAMFAAELPIKRVCDEEPEIERQIGQRFTILHADAVDEMADAGAVIVGSDALFPPESVILHGLRSAAGVRVDEAILDAVSILTAGNSILAPTFLQMISDKTELLKPVDSLTYEDGMGISAWVDNNRVLIGNRSLMENHNVRMPSQDIEQTESQKGRMILYLARRGELITAFSLSLQVMPQVKRMLGQARTQGMRIYVRSVDCLIENNLVSLFGEDADMIGILPSRLHNDYLKETHREGAALSLILSDGSAYAALGAVLQLQRLRASLEINRLLVVVLLAIAGLFFAGVAMAGNPVLISAAAALIPVLLHLAFFLPRR